MLEIELLPQALLDFEDIFDYTLETWTYTQAIKYTSLIDECISDIAKGKINGRDYSYASGNYKFLKVGKHIIFYKIENSKCIIVRILHQRMDLENYL